MNTLENDLNPRDKDNIIMFGIESLRKEIVELKEMVSSLQKDFMEHFNEEVTFSEIQTQLRYQMNEFLEELDKKLSQKEYVNAQEVFPFKTLVQNKKSKKK